MACGTEHLLMNNKFTLFQKTYLDSPSAEHNLSEEKKQVLDNGIIYHIKVFERDTTNFRADKLQGFWSY